MQEIIIPIMPVPKGRPQFYCGHAVTPKRTREYEELVRCSWLSGKVEGKYLSAKLWFVFPVPRSSSKKQQAELLYKPYNRKKDLDNLIKSTLDGLQGAAYDNDAKIVSINAMKLYGFDPCVIVRIEPVEELDLGEIADEIKK